MVAVDGRAHLLGPGRAEGFRGACRMSGGVALRPSLLSDIYNALGGSEENDTAQIL